MTDSLAQYDFDKFSPNTFAFAMPSIPGASNSDMLVLNVFSVNLPSLELGAKDIRWQGATTHIPDAVTNWGALTIQFMVDSNLSNWISLFKWITYMHNNKDRYAVSKDMNYALDTTLVMLDNWKKPIVNFKFINTFPTSLSECQMSYREGTRYIDASVSFKYDYYDVETIN